MPHDDTRPYLAAFLESFHNLGDAEFAQLREALNQRAEFFHEHAPELAVYLQVELHDEMERQQELKAGEPRDPEFGRWTNDAIGGALMASLGLMDVSATGKLYEFASHLMHTVVCEAAMRLKQDQRLREITERWQQ